MQLHFEIPEGAEVPAAVAEAAAGMARDVTVAVGQIDGLTVTAVLVPPGAYSGLVAIGDVPVVRAPVPDSWQLAVVPCDEVGVEAVDPFVRIGELEAELEVVSLAMVTAKAALEREQTRAREDVAAVQRQLAASQQELAQAKRDRAASQAALAKHVDLPGAAQAAGQVRELQEANRLLRGELDGARTELGSVRASLELLRAANAPAREKTPASLEPGVCVFCGRETGGRSAAFCEEDLRRLPEGYRRTLAVQQSRAQSSATSGAAQAYERAVQQARVWLRQNPADTAAFETVAGH